MEGIFFAKFDDIAGPIIVCQASQGKENCLGTDLFDRVSDFIIAKKELCGSLLTVSDAHLSGKKVMSCPLFVENEKLYKRNAFFFAFGFVFQDEVQAGPFTTVLKKLSNAMKSLEIESGFLSGPSAGKRIQNILARVLSELSKWGECIVSIDEANTLALKITPRLIDPPEVFDYQVPVQVRDLEDFVSKEWDLTMLQVMHFVDGERHIKLIAELSGVAVALVRRCIRQLLYFRCVRLVDIFQYSNAYACTPRIIELAENDALQRQCLKYIWNGNGEPPLPSRIFQLYSSLQPCLDFKDFCLLFDTNSLGIDDRKFVTFGVLHGLVKRVHSVPVSPATVEKSNLHTQSASDIYKSNVLQFQREDNEPRLPSSTSSGELDAVQFPHDESLREGTQISDEMNRPANFTSLLNGRNNFDAICTELWCSVSEVESMLRNHPNACVIHK